MALLLIIILLIFVLSIYRYDHNIINPAIAFLSVWLVVISAYSIGYVKFYNIDMLTYLIMLIGFIAFYSGYYIRKIVKTSMRKNSFKLISYEFRYKFIFVLGLVSIAMLLGEAVSNIALLRTGVSFNDINIQKVIEGNVNSETGLQKSISVLLVQPFSFAILPIWAMDYLGGKRKKWLTIMTILYIACYSLLEGRRFMLIYGVLIFIIVLLSLGHKIRFGKREIFMFLLLLLIAASGIIYLSASRGIVDLSKSIYVYFCGCIPHLDYRLSQINLSGKYTYGLAVLSGYLTPIFIGMKGILGVPYPDFWIRTTTLLNVENTVLIGDGVTFNAFVSPFFYFYLDAGILGIALGMMIYGIISTTFYKAMITNMSIRNVCNYALIVLGLVFSMFQLYFVSYPYALSFVYIWILTKRERRYTSVTII